MSTLGILDLVIGLFFIYFVFSVICSSIIEILSQLFNWRSKELYYWLSDLYDNNQRTKAGLSAWMERTFMKHDDSCELWHHHLLQGLTRKGREPDYIPASTFANALLSQIVGYGKRDNGIVTDMVYDVNKLKDALENGNLHLNKDVKAFLLQAIQDAGNAANGIALVKKRLEEWFDHSMDRVEGTYRKHARAWTFWLAMIVAAGANVDTLELTKYLKEHPEERTLLVEQAERSTTDSLLIHKVLANLESINQHTADSLTVDSLVETTTASIDNLLNGREKEALDELESLGLPLGWNKETKVSGFWPIAMKILGIILTGFALTLGAPFWFDSISKLVDIRSSGVRPSRGEGETAKPTA